MGADGRRLHARGLDHTQSAGRASRLAGAVLPTDARSWIGRLRVVQPLLARIGWSSRRAAARTQRAGVVDFEEPALATAAGTGRAVLVQFAMPAERGAPRERPGASPRGCMAKVRQFLRPVLKVPAAATRSLYSAPATHVAAPGDATTSASSATEPGRTAPVPFLSPGWKV